MRVKYIAIDGTEFDESELCETHECEIAKKDYERKFVAGSLAARADKMISIYESYCDARRMSDEHLKDEGSETRYSDEPPFCGDFRRGIMYLRDDAVDILVARIRQLEAENERIIGQLPRKMQNEEIKRLAAELRDIGK